VVAVTGGGGVVAGGAVTGGAVTGGVVGVGVGAGPGLGAPPVGAGAGPPPEDELEDGAGPPPPPDDPAPLEVTTDPDGPLDEPLRPDGAPDPEAADPDPEAADPDEEPVTPEAVVAPGVVAEFGLPGTVVPPATAAVVVPPTPIDASWLVVSSMAWRSWDIAALSAAICPETWAAVPAAAPVSGVELTAQAMVIPVTPAVAAAATVDETMPRRLRPGCPLVALVIGTIS